MMVFLSLFGLLQSQAQTRVGLTASESGNSVPSNMASTYVPIESWVYAAIERLALAGYVQTAFASLRPWTRMDCARLIEEAKEQVTDNGATEPTLQLLKELGREFAPELRRLDGDRNREFRIESMDVRSTTISGAPLTDGYHGAQTITNDYGRPYGRGENVYSGITLRATAGLFSGYLRTELQRAASAPSALPSASASIAAADFTPTAAAGPASGFNRGRIVEGYVSFAFHDNQFTFGKQALWWGPGQGGPLLFSNNAAPITMFRYDRVRPFELPGIGRWLGPIRVQAFAGRLSGQQFVRVAEGAIGQSGVALRNQPFIHGQKLSLKPTPNLEVSVSRTVIFAGAGAPLTTRSVLRSLFSSGNTDSKADPGDRRSAVDVQYRIPKLRNWLTAYVDTFTDDEPFPLNYPTESAWSPGVYLSHVPKLEHMDLRVEGFLTPHRDLFPGFYYFNVHYLSGYTNQRQLIGSWIGREGEGIQAWSTWWLSPRSSLQASYRHVSASSEFLQGGSLQDVSLTADVALHPEWRMHVVVQDERWRFPIFSATSQHNLTTTFQLSYQSRGSSSVQP